MSARLDALRALLAGHVPADATEADHRARMLALTEAGPGALDRDHWAPGHFTASAFVLSPDRAALLLVFHGKLHRWLQPGGHIEPFDLDVRAAARREIAEEVGLTDVHDEGVLDLDVHVIPARKADPAHAHFDVRFLFVARDLVFRAGDDALDARWMPLADVTADNTDDSVARAVRKLGARAP